MYVTIQKFPSHSTENLYFYILRSSKLRLNLTIKMEILIDYGSKISIFLSLGIISMLFVLFLFFDAMKENC